jgi:uncharacterized membrane protein
VPAGGGTAGDLAYAAAPQHGELSVVSGISWLYRLVTMALAMALQGRRARLSEAVGLALALAGAIVLGASRG